jgi:hypothetical protein
VHADVIVLWCVQVNSRMGGGPVYAMNQFVWGVDLVEEQFLGCCGILSRPYLSKTPQKCIAEFSVNAQKTGTLQNADWVDVSAQAFLCTRPCRQQCKPGTLHQCLMYGF